MLQTLSILTTLIALPALFSFWLVTGAYRPVNHVRGRISDALVFASYLGMLGAIIVLAPFAFGVFWLRYIALACMALAIARFLLTWRRTMDEPATILARISQGFSILLGAIFTAAAIAVVVGARPPAGDSPVDLAFPLKDGRFAVVHGGASPLVNYHQAFAAQRYALDIVALNVAGMRASGFMPSQNEDYVIWETDIVSPCDGEVVFSRDGLEDAVGAQRERETPAGNMVALDCGGVTVLIAHIRKGAVAVSPGDVVRIGDPIGKVGNSGNTSEPHLHIHAEYGDFDGERSKNEGAPIRFDGKFLVRNSVVIN